MNWRDLTPDEAHEIGREIEKIQQLQLTVAFFTGDLDRFTYWNLLTGLRLTTATFPC